MNYGAAKLVVTFSLAFCLTFNSLNLYSENLSDSEPIVISATKNKRTLSSVASSVTVIDQQELDRQQSQSVTEILSRQPELDVVSAGTKGASTSVSIRGANAEHTLVVLDGIELNNPVLPSRSFNFADLLLSDISQIEILRGSQSTLYGSDAMAGVINITSQKAQKELEFSALSEAGSNSTFTEKIGLSAAQETYDYAFSFLRQDSAGISAADSRLGNTENDSYGNSSYFARIGFNPEKAVNFSNILRAIDSSAELDNFGGSFGDDPNRELDNQQYFWGSSLNIDLAENRLKTNLSYSLSDQSFSDNNDPDSSSPELLRSKYEGFSQAVRLNLDYQSTDYLNLMLGLETEEEKGESKYFSDGSFGSFESNFDQRSSTTNGVFTQAIFDFTDYASVSAGIRADDQSAFGSRTTWKLAPVFNFKETGLRVFSTAATAYKAPSLFQLYSSYGTPGLDAEESFAVDAGFEKNIIEDAISLQMTYFNQDFDDLIDFDPNTFIFSNINSARTQGLESQIKISVTENLFAKLGYTYLDATNQDTGEALLRRARHKLAADITYKPCEQTDLSLRNNYRSASYDNDFSGFEAQRTNLAGYATVDLLASYQIDSQLRFFGRVENIFDNNYQQVLGYGTYGISAYAGLEYRS